MARTALKALSKPKKRREKPAPPPPPEVPVMPVKETNWPSSPEANPGAKCYVCGDIVNKSRMVRIGQNAQERGTDRHIWRCNSASCATGGSKWRKYFLGKSKMCRYYLSTLTKEEVAAMPEERQQDIGKLLVKHKVELATKAICDAVDKKKRSKKNGGTRKRLPVSDVPSKKGRGQIRSKPTSNAAKKIKHVEAKPVRKPKKRGRSVSIRRVK